MAFGVLKMSESNFNPHNPYGLTFKQAFFHPYSVIAFLVVFSPIGLTLMWVGNVWSKAVRIGITILFSLLIVSVFTGSNTPDNIPKDQKSFVSEIKSLQSEYRAAENNKNEAVINKVLTKSNAFFKTKRSIENWVVTVESVKQFVGEDKYFISANDYSGIEYHLFSDDELSQKSFKKLNSGDPIIISGKINGEGSFTQTGAIEEPEIMVTISE